METPSPSPDPDWRDRVERRLELGDYAGALRLLKVAPADDNTDFEAYRALCLLKTSASREEMEKGGAAFENAKLAGPLKARLGQALIQAALSLAKTEPGWKQYATYYERRIGV